MNKTPRIIILMHYMELGGAESALLGLLQSIDIDMVDVDLFLYDHRGDLMKFVYELSGKGDKNEALHARGIRLLPQLEGYSMLERPLTEIVKKGYWSLALMRLLGKAEVMVTGGNELVAQPKWAAKVLPPIVNGNYFYDLAISFMAPHIFVLDKVNAKKKVGWIHTDYTKIPVDVKREVKMWERLDRIISISPDASKAFLQVFPSLKDKVEVIENIISPEFVRQRAEEIVDENDNENQNYCSTSSTQKLLSVGRICEAKNYDNIPYIAKMMKEMGVKFHWYIIGPGDHQSIDEKLKELKMDSWVSFLGPRSNPYPYIKACDVYLQPSRYEGKSVTVREAQILCKPVVVTNYATAQSQIKDGMDGVIVPMDNEGCAKGIVDFLNNKEKQKRIVAYLKCHDFGNVSEVEKIYQLVDKN